LDGLESSLFLKVWKLKTLWMRSIPQRQKGAAGPGMAPNHTQ